MFFFGNNMGPSQNYFQNWLNLHWVKLAKENLTKTGLTKLVKSG